MFYNNTHKKQVNKETTTYVENYIRKVTYRGSKINRIYYRVYVPKRFCKNRKHTGRIFNDLSDARAFKQIMHQANISDNFKQQHELKKEVKLKLLDIVDNMKIGEIYKLISADSASNIHNIFKRHLKNRKIQSVVKIYARKNNIYHILKVK